MNERVRNIFTLLSGLCVILWGLNQPAEAQKKSWTEKITISGDFRNRFEGFYNRKNATTGADIGSRNRIRIRSRISLSAEINRFTVFSLRLATGNQGDPISTNETISTVFGHPSINLDRGFIRFKYSSSSKPVTVSADIGTFGNPAYSKTQVVWDSDLNPSGIVEKLTVKGELPKETNYVPPSRLKPKPKTGPARLQEIFTAHPEVAAQYNGWNESKRKEWEQLVGV